MNVPRIKLYTDYERELTDEEQGQLREPVTRAGEVADAVVIDHFIGGDGSANGSRTNRTPLPDAMAAVDGRSVAIEYRERMVKIAQRYFPGRVGVNIEGFAGRFL